jgi:pimeloyl-ACP methyl ester carboxylesterase
VLRDLQATDEAFVIRDGVRVHYQVFGEGNAAILLLPSWSVVHSDIWARQVAHLSADHTVITFDGRGNGASDRPLDVASYSDWVFAADALAVLDSVEVGEAAVVSMSGGATSGLILASENPSRVWASVFIAPALSLTPPYPERAAAAALFDQPQARYEGWLKFNRNYWQEDWEGFLEFFSAKCFTEPNSQDDIRRWVEMGLETSPEVIIATSEADGPGADEQRRLIAALQAPVLVIHGTDDQVIPLGRSQALADLTGGKLAVIEGSGHEPQYRHPGQVNRILDEFFDTYAPR